MTQKNETDSKTSSSKKAHFPTPPWQKNTTKKTETTDETIPVSPEEINEQDNPEECEEPALADSPEESEAAAKSPEEIPAATKEAPKQADAKRQNGDIHFSNIADAFLKVQATLKKTEEELEKTKADLEKATDGYTRAVADFDNYRRRTNEERPKNMLYAKGDIAKDVFPVLDNFKLGLEAAEKQHPEAKTILEGFAMIASQLRNALAQHGIVEINPLGEPFNPQEHESLSMMPSAEVPADHVLFVQRTGYKIGERLLRPASVVISAGQQ